MIAAKFQRLEETLGDGPFFAGAQFSLVDAFARVFRYFELFDRITGPGLFDGRLKLSAWREALAARPSVRGAVPADYLDRLQDFIRTKGSHLASLELTEAWTPQRASIRKKT